MPNINLSILNQKATPAFFADTLANRPAPSFVGRIFISTDTLDLYRDTGTAWLLLSPSSTGTITGSGAAGQVTYFSAASSITGNNNLFYDTALSHLGINTNTPGSALDVHDDQSTLVQLNQTISTNDTRIGFQNSGTALWRIGNFYNAGENDWGIFDVVGAAQPFTIKKTTGQTFIGAQTTSSGRLVVNNSSGDNHIVVIGATAPSIRINNAGTGATRQIGIGLATTTNNFIQGAAGGEMAIFNSNTTASPILFGIYDAGLGNTQEAARISASRNFIVGSSVDNGSRLQINGAATFSSSVTANSLVKSGGTSSQILAADGSVITAGTGITISGGTIQATSSGGVTGFGTIGTIPLWFGATTNIGNSQITQATSNIFIGGSYGTTSKLNVAGDIDANGNIKKAGTTVLNVSAFTIPIGNVAVGQTLVDSSIIDDGTNVYIGTATFVPRTTFASAQLVMNGSATTTNTINSLYLTSCAGIPTSAPSTYTNKQAIMVDRTNFRLYVYVGGSWKYTQLV